MYVLQFATIGVIFDMHEHGH